ncbi:MAG: hypothetical protein GW917_02055, partial [Bdellovibrionales bacterium]|nr:hypothetical protein [Bdellovibrionales bacterium]
DISMVKRALDLASSLLSSECGGVVSEDHYDLHPQEKRDPEILVRFSYVAERLGYPVDSNEFLDFMKRLGLKVLKSDDREALLRAPSHRVDIEQEVDLVEEFGRMKGYDQIPEVLPVMDSEPLPHDSRWILEEALVESMISLGYLQAINYGFTSEKGLLNLFGDGTSLRDEKISYPQTLVKLKNPLSEELGAMRSSLVPGLLQNFQFNVRHGNKVGRLFELGSRFSQSDQEGKSSYSEESMLGLLAWGSVEGLWQSTERAPLFFEVKSILERLFQRFHLGGVKGQLFEPLFGSLEFRSLENPPSFLHPGQSASLFCEGKIIGYVGSLHPNVLSESKMKDSAVMAEVEVSSFQRALGRKLNVKTPSKYQSVERDIAFIAPKEQSAHSIIQVIKKVTGAYLQGVTVTDEFVGGDLAEGMKSVS